MWDSDSEYEITSIGDPRDAMIRRKVGRTRLERGNTRFMAYVDGAFKASKECATRSSAIGDFFHLAKNSLADGSARATRGQFAVIRGPVGQHRSSAGARSRCEEDHQDFHEDGCLSHCRGLALRTDLCGHYEGACRMQSQALPYMR